MPKIQKFHVVLNLGPTNVSLNRVADRQSSADSLKIGALDLGESAESVAARLTIAQQGASMTCEEGHCLDEDWKGLPAR